MSVSFDRIADRYDATRGFPPEVTATIGAALVRAAGLRADSRVLEIGVGTGRIARPVLAAAPAGLRYLGVDIAAAMLARLRAQLPSSHALDLLRADVTRLPLASQSCDLVIEAHVLHLVSSVDDTLAEVRRVLRPGGALLRVYNRSPEGDPLGRLRGAGWQAVVSELGGGHFLRAAPRAHAVSLAPEQLHGFDAPAMLVLARWQRQETPRAVLAGLAERTWSSTWTLPEPLLQATVERLREQAQQQFGDLDMPQTSVLELVAERYPLLAEVA